MVHLGLGLGTLGAFLCLCLDLGLGCLGLGLGSLGLGLGGLDAFLCLCLDLNRPQKGLFVAPTTPSTQYFAYYAHSRLLRLVSLPESLALCQSLCHCPSPPRN